MKKILALVVITALLFLTFFILKMSRVGYYFLPAVPFNLIGITTSILFFSFLYLLKQKRKETKPVSEETKIEELEKVLYVCQAVKSEISKAWVPGKPTPRLYKKSWYIARKIVLSLEELLRNYREFLMAHPTLGRAVYDIIKLWNHYHGGKRIKTPGPYEEMGSDLIFLYEEISKVLRKYKLTFRRL